MSIELTDSDIGRYVVTRGGSVIGPLEKNDTGLPSKCHHFKVGVNAYQPNGCWASPGWGLTGDDIVAFVDESAPGLKLTDDDVGKEFITRDGYRVTLERRVARPPKSPYLYQYRHPLMKMCSVDRDGSFFGFDESDQDLIARLNPAASPDRQIREEVRATDRALRDTDPDMRAAAEEETGFQVKDSGRRQSFESGMVRDTTEGKIDWHRTADGPMLKRWAEHLTKGKDKYPDVRPGEPNWMLAEGVEEMQRFRQSAFRHFLQWYFHDNDEDHAAAVMFNINGFEFVKQKLHGEVGAREAA